MMSYPGMFVNQVSSRIYFTQAGNDEKTMAIFQSWSEHSAKECYLHLCECLTDPESHGCDLPRYDAKMKVIWDHAIPAYTAVSALRETYRQGGASREELNRLRQAVYAFSRSYCSDEGYLYPEGKVLERFCRIQEEVQQP